MKSLLHIKSLSKNMANNFQTSSMQEEINKAKTFEVYGKYSEAIRIYTKCASDMKKEYGKTNRKTKNMFLKLSELHYKAKDYEKAVIFYEKCVPDINYVQKITNTKVLDIYINLGVCYRELSKYELSLHYFQSLLSKYKNKFNEKIFDIYINIAIAYENKKEYDKSIYSIDKLIELCEKNNKLFFLGKAYLKRAQIYSIMDENNYTIEYYNLAYESFIKSIEKYDFDMVEIYEGLGKAYEYEEEYQEAENLYRDILKIYKKILEEKILIKCKIDEMGCLGIIEHFEKAIETIKRNNNKRIHMCINIGKAYMIIKKYNMATDYFKYALNYYKKENNKNKKLLLEIYELLSKSYESEEKYDLVIKTTNKYVELYKTIEHYNKKEDNLHYVYVLMGKAQNELMRIGRRKLEKNLEDIDENIASLF